MPSVEKPPLKPFMSVLYLLPFLSWRCLVETTFLIAQRSPAFWPRLIPPLSKPCAASFKRIWEHGPDPRSLLEAYGIEQEATGWWWMWTAPDRPPGNAPY